MAMPRQRKHDRHLPPRLRRKGESLYHVDKGKWVKVGTTDDMQAALEAHRAIELANQKPDRNTVAGLAATYRALLKDPRNPLGLRDSTIKGYLKQLRPEGILLKFLGHGALNEIRPAHIGDYLDNHPSPVSANREIALLSRMFKYATRRGWCDLNPCMGVEKNRETARNRYVTDEEYAAVRELASPSVGIAMDVSYLTGLRMGDVLNIRIDDYDHKCLAIREGKTSTRVRFEMTDALYAVLEAHKELPGKAKGFYVVRTRKGRQYGVDGFRAIWQRLQRRAIEKGKLKERFTFHDIRAKHATDRDEESINTQLALGHLSADMTERYIRSPKGRMVRPLK